MAVDQLPGRMREFANYLQGLLGRLDQGGGWCGVFWQRDPEGMRACLEGHEVPPWDVVEALLQDLGAAYGAGAEAPAPERERARVLHLAALAAHDSRPGGRDALGDRLDIMLGEQRYAAERLADLGRRTGGTTTREGVEALRLELAWARDDHERATARCAELRARMAAYDRRTPAGPAPDGRSPAGPAPDARIRDDRAGQVRPARLSAAEVTDRRADDARAAARGAGAPRVPRQRDAAAAPGATGPEARYEAWEDPARPRYDLAPGPGQDRAPAPPAPGFRGGAPYDATSAARAFDAPHSRADAPAAPPEPHPDPAPPVAPAPAPSGRQRSKRRRGSARFAGMAEPGNAPGATPPEAPPTPPAAVGRSPRGARFAGAAEAGRQQPEEPGGGQPDGESRLAVAATIESLVRLRGEGRSGEAHAVLVEAAHWPAARFPLLAAELQRADLGADWVTLLWEAAGLPAEELVAAADALTAAGRTDDGQQILRQGVARPAAEIGLAVLGLADQDRHREVGALLDAYVRVRTPEEAARSAEPDPERLVPLLLEAARGVSDERHWDLVHALRVAGLTA